MTEPSRQLESLSLGALPIIEPFLRRIGLPRLLQQALGPQHHRSKLSHENTLLVLLKNIIISQEPLYALQPWAELFVPEALGIEPHQLSLLNDDRIGRALDQLFLADRATLQTSIILKMVRAFDLELEQLHNDSTSITFSGEFDSQKQPQQPSTPPSARITHGYNKDHRPDLKQLVCSLTISSDGAVPVLCQILDGNTPDIKTHIETWNLLRKLVGHPKFIYVADSKLCSRENMNHIDSLHGQFITIMPRNRAENARFKDLLQTQSLPWAPLPLSDDQDQEVPPDDKPLFEGVDDPLKSSEGFRIVWIRSAHKWKAEQAYRQSRIDRALFLIGTLQSRAGKRELKTKQQLTEYISKLLKENRAERWVTVDIEETVVHESKQVSRGRPGKNTAYRTNTRSDFKLTPRLLQANIDYDARTDGIFPLITNLTDMPIRDILACYKYQPNLENRNRFLKSVLEVTPVNLKTPSRIEALLFLYFIALLVHALIEREIRKTMQANGVQFLPLHPELRPIVRPTSVRILETFATLRRHRLRENSLLVQTFWDHLNPIQRQILQLLEISPEFYGQ